MWELCGVAQSQTRLKRLSSSSMKHGPKFMETWDKFNPGRHEEREETSENLSMTREAFKRSCDIQGTTGTKGEVSE